MTQEFKPAISKMVERSIVKQRTAKRMHLPQQKDSLIKQFKAYMAKAKNDNIRYLPQDHMPWIVPDAAAIAIIPNAWPHVQVPFKSAIPNPMTPEDKSR